MAGRVKNQPGQNQAQNYRQTCEKKRGALGGYVPLVAQSAKVGRDPGKDRPGFVIMLGQGIQSFELA